MVDTLVHLPPLPLVVDYRYATAAQDQLGISHALQLRHRLRRLVLCIPPWILDQLLVHMGDLFPVLEHVSLSLSAENGTNLLLPSTFLAPNLRHLTLLGILLPKQLPLLSVTVSLVTLTLPNIRDFGYFLPQRLVARLRLSPQLEELFIGFSVPLPRPSAQKELLQEMEAVATLPLLKRLTFRGVSAYLESLVAQIRAPLLEDLNITLFDQIHFALPHLSHFTNTTEGLTLPIAKITFKNDAVSLLMDRGQHQGAQPSSFSLQVTCRQFDWQIDAASRICDELGPTLSGVEQLSLDSEGQNVPAEWQDGAVDRRNMALASRAVHRSENSPYRSRAYMGAFLCVSVGRNKVGRRATANFGGNRRRSRRRARKQCVYVVHRGSASRRSPNAAFGSASSVSTTGTGSARARLAGSGTHFLQKGKLGKEDNNQAI